VKFWQLERVLSWKRNSADRQRCREMGKERVSLLLLGFFIIIVVVITIKNCFNG
jgi:hypothetical protein